MLEVLADYDLKSKRDGATKQLEQYKNFKKPYNDAFWALAHFSIPFNLEHHGAPTGSGDQLDYVCQHPLVMAEGLELAQYKSKYNYLPVFL